ncbi:MAG: type II toxin-antitoxin system RelE/ParE family toxin [Crocinitomicaceae bacterium]
MEEVRGKVRDILFYERYFEIFFLKQSPKIQEKMIWTLELLQELPVIPVQYMKHIHGTNGLYEIRIQQGSDIFRIFSFFDEGKIVVLLNAFQKKTQKLPRQEIKRAVQLKKTYEKNK